jgi:hypothetical protein
VDPPVDHESRGVSLNQVGACLMRWKSTRSRSVVPGAVEAKEQGDAQGRVNPESLSNTLHHLGSCLSGMGQHEKAQGILSAAAQQRQRATCRGAWTMRAWRQPEPGGLLPVENETVRDGARVVRARRGPRRNKGDVQGRVDHDSVRSA